MESLQKAAEHLRQIHFAMLLLTATLGYIALSAWRDAPELQRELTTLRSLVVTLAATKADLVRDQKTSSTADQLKLAVQQLLLTIHEPFLNERRTQLATALKQVAQADDTGSFPFQSAIVIDKIRLDGVPDLTQTIEIIRNDLDKMEVVVPLLWPKPNQAAFGPRPAKTSSSYVSIKIAIEEATKKFIVQRVQVTVITPPPDSPARRSIITTNPIDTLDVAADIREFRVKLAPSFSERFPRLIAGFEKLGVQTLDEASVRLQEEERRAISAKRAKVFELEVEGSDIIFVISIAIVFTLFYCRAYLKQLRDSLAPLTTEQVTQLRGVWIGTHDSALAKLIVWFSVAGAVVAVCVCQWRYGDGSLASFVLGLATLVVAVLAAVELQQLRNALATNN